MPITRSVWIDDDGSGTTGTVLNNSELQKIYNNIDGQITMGDWVPVDASGAGLVFNVLGSRYWQFDKLVMIDTVFVYPATANSATAAIGGLPFPNGQTYGGFYSANAAVNLTYLVNPGASVFTPQKIVAAASFTNAELSGVGLTIVGVYLRA